MFFAVLGAQLAWASSPILEQSYNTNIDNGWDLVERYRTDESAILAEAFPPDGRGDQTGQRATFFGAAQPHSNLFLLYHMPGWDTNPNAVPILLVHGATQNADQAWANPSDPSGVCGRLTCPSTGLAQELATDWLQSVRYQLSAI
jgi:hypothetical protein